MSDGELNIAMLIIKISTIFLIGTIIFVNIGGTTVLNKTDSVTLQFTKNPANGETIKVGQHIYEFSDDDTATNGCIPVPIGTTLEITVNNFRNIAEENYDVA